MLGRTTMDVGDVFRQGLGSVIPRPPQPFSNRKPVPVHRDDASEPDLSSHRIAHTLTACCRCRQRKTRCDPTLPRCLPCERTGSICEYFDAIKGKKISRSYVVRLQEKVKQLESELAQYTDEDNDYPRNNEDMVRPGGLVRMGESDETPRYLGPSSGIAMTRLLMEGAKRFTESTRISELIPDVRARRVERMNRMQSLSYGNGSISGPSSRKKSYPIISAHPAQSLPTRPIADKLLEVFFQRAQVLMPILHEIVLTKDLEDVFAGSTDPYKNFVVRMMMAISLQKLDTQYAGLADSYYLSSMQYFEDVVRPKDLKTLQCLALIGSYSLLTPTRMAVYYIIGLATRICQQLGLGEEKTVAAGYSIGLLDPLTLDMRRRLSWIVATMEFGLAHSMGRPNGFSKENDLMDVKFFATVDDEYITENGILDGPPSGRKLAAVHFCNMRMLQAEIRRTLYEKKRLEPKHDGHPWFVQMSQKIKDWLDSTPEEPAWCKPWFTGRYHTMVVFLNRPSPQIPKPTGQAALKCFDSSAFLLNLFNQQVKKAAVDVTWVLLITIYMALNTILWSISYQEVRAAHPREELEELVNLSLIMMDQCSERWPGVQPVSQLYSIFAQACMQSYESKPEPPAASGVLITSALNTPPSLTDTSSPSASEASGTLSNATGSHQPQHSQAPPMFNAPQFGYIFDTTPEQISAGFNFDPDASPFQNPHPTFRSNSIFLNPASTDSTGRRFSYFPPEFTHHPGEPHHAEHSEDPTPPATSTPYNSQTSPPLSTPVSNPLPTPPESLVTHSSLNPSQVSLSPTVTMTGTSSPTPPMPQASPPTHAAHGSPTTATLSPFKSDQPTSQLPTMNPQNLNNAQQPLPVPPPTKGSQGISHPSTPQPPQRTPAFTIPPLPQQHVASAAGGSAGTSQQRPAQPHPPPTTVTDWFSPPPPFISPYAFSSGAMTGSFWGDGGGSGSSGGASSAYQGLGLGLGGGGAAGAGGGYAGLALPGPVWGGDGAGGLPQYAFPGERQGSLSQEQQVELMGVLETEGMGEIDALLLGLGADGEGTGQATTGTTTHGEMLNNNMVRWS